MPFCRKCGKKLPEKANFCSACGTKILASIVVPSQEISQIQKDGRLPREVLVAIVGALAIMGVVCLIALGVSRTSHPQEIPLTITSASIHAENLRHETYGGPEATIVLELSLRNDSDSQVEIRKGITAELMGTPVLDWELWGDSEVKINGVRVSPMSPFIIPPRGEAQITASSKYNLGLTVFEPGRTYVLTLRIPLFPEGYVEWSGVVFHVPVFYRSS